MKKKTRRRVYSTEPGFNPVLYALEGAAPIGDELLNKLRLLDLSSIDSFALGRATMQDLTNLLVTLNASELLARAGVGPEALPICAAAEAALIAVNDRRQAGGVIGTDEAGLDALRELFDVYDVQRQCLTRGQYEKLMARVKAIMLSDKDSPRTVTELRMTSSRDPAHG